MGGASLGRAKPGPGGLRWPRRPARPQRDHRHLLSCRAAYRRRRDPTAALSERRRSGPRGEATQSGAATPGLDRPGGEAGRRPPGPVRPADPGGHRRDRRNLSGPRLRRHSLQHRTGQVRQRAPTGVAGRHQGADGFARQNPVDGRRRDVAVPGRRRPGGNDVAARVAMEPGVLPTGRGPRRPSGGDDVRHHVADRLDLRNAGRLGNQPLAVRRRPRHHPVHGRADLRGAAARLPSRSGEHGLRPARRNVRAADRGGGGGAAVRRRRLRPLDH